MKDMKDHPLLLGLVLLLAASASAAAQDAKIDAANELIVNVSNIQHTDGRIGCTLFSKEDGFPSKAEKADKRVWVQHKSDKVTCKFRNVKPGEYAIAVMHDEDKNGELNTSLVGRPQEGWGVSKNVPPRRFGPPNYEDAKFKYTGGQMTIDIKLRY
jgi:uncharacterized protein (DUF2141 family)